MERAFDHAHAALSFLRGGGEMGQLIRHHDWAATELGTPDTWPAALKTAVRLMLTTNYPIVLFAGPHHIQLYNDAYARTLGPERHPSALGVSAAQCWPEIWSAIGPEIEAVLAGRGATWHEDVPFKVWRHGRLEETWWTYGYSPIEDDGKVHGALAMCNEITAIHSRKAMLRQSYTTLVESMDQGFCVLELLEDAAGTVHDFRFLECNPAFEQQCGLHDVPGKKLSELMKEVEPWWLERIVQAQRSGAPQRFEVHSPAMARFFDAYAFRIGAAAQRKAGLLLRDITQHKRDEEALLESRRHALAVAHQAEADHQRLAAVLEAAPAGILVADAKGGVLQVNHEFQRIWGSALPATGSVADYGEWQGWWADDSAHHGQPLSPEDWPMARALRSGAMAGGVIEIESFDQPPRRRTVSSSAAPVFDGEGRLLGGVIALMDITDRVRAEGALREADRRKDEFLAMLAHELRNPLAPVAAAADLLALDSANTGRARQTSAIISRQVKHMTGLIDDLLDVSRVTRGLVKLEKKPLDAKRIVADAVEQVRPLVEARQHALTLHITPDPAPVCGDHKRLVQVLTNLLTNAAKYTPNGGAIVLHLGVEARRVLVQVEDNGIGMSAPLIEHAFDLFTQAERSADRSQGGLGIGLALVRSLVELHGGAVFAASAGPGLGSTFTVSLPLFAEAPKPATAPETGPQLARGAAPKRVLVVDDNVDAADMLGAFVQTLGHEVDLAHDADSAQDLARRHRPDICLLDIGLPETDGYQLARRLREDPATENATLVAVTGYGQERDRVRAADAGFDHYLIKPVATDKLAELLKYGHFRNRAAAAPS